MTVQNMTPIHFSDDDDSNPNIQHVDAPAESPFSLAWTVQAIAGLALTLLGMVVVYETFAIFMIGSTGWMNCINSDGTLMMACGNNLTTAYDYRLGMNALTALLLGLVAVFMGPIPIITMLNRFRSNAVAGVLFLVVMFPYGLLAFIVVVLGMMSAVFYGVELLR